MNIAIIDCGAGNLHSVRKAFARMMPSEVRLNIVTDANALADATHIVLPGVGAFADCMEGLNTLPGMREALEKHVLHGTTPFFGICVGMQMLFERGHEHATTPGLGWFKGEVTRMTPADPALRIPHMGWNRLKLQQPHPVLAGIQPDDYAYFVHSYAVTGMVENELLASVDYGGPIVAMVGRNNIVASQFHPEKSQRAGLAMIANFLQWGA
jgi:glutamine amidotransferase